MRKLIFLILLISVFVISCGLIDFDYDTNSNGQIDKVQLCPTTISQLIPDSLKNNMNDEMNQMISNSFDSIVKKVKKQDTWPADEVSIKKFSLDQTNIPSSLESSTTLGFISELKIYISYQDDSKKILLASVKNSDAKATKLIFVSGKQNIVDYIDKGFKVIIESKIRDCPSVDIKFKANITAHIKL